MATREQLEDALRNADAAGDTAAARQLAQAIQGGQFDDAPPPTEDPSLLGQAADVGLEFAAGVNRGVAGLVDFAASPVNAALQLAGADAQIPSVTEALAPATAGGFVEDPTVRQVAGMAGEFSAPAPPIAALSRGGDDAFELAGDLLTTGTPITKVPGQQPTAIDRIKQAIPQSPTKQKIAEKIKAEPGNVEVGKYIVNSAGRVEGDKLFTEAAKQGFDESVLAAAKGSTRVDRDKMLEMVNVLKKGRENARFASLNRPTDIAGQSLLERVKHVKSTNREAGKAVDAAAQSLKGQAVDIGEPVAQFGEKLQELGVRLVDDGKGGFKPNFDDSVLAPGDRGPMKEVVRQMSRLSRKQPDALTVHNMKKIIDNNVTFGKTKTGLGGQAEGALKEFRTGLDGALDSTFPAYNEANTVYAETINALGNLQTAAGTKLDFFGPNSDKALGTTLRRTLSNAQSRVNLIDSIDELEKVARNTGGEFSDDILSQVLFADELDKVFGAAARTSLKGQGEQIARRGAALARGDTGELTTSILGGAIDNIRGINEENAIKSIEAFLRR